MWSLICDISVGGKPHRWAGCFLFLRSSQEFDEGRSNAEPIVRCNGYSDCNAQRADEFGEPTELIQVSDRILFEAIRAPTVAPHDSVVND